MYASNYIITLFYGTLFWPRDFGHGNRAIDTNIHPTILIFHSRKQTIDTLSIKNQKGGG